MGMARGQIVTRVMGRGADMGQLKRQNAKTPKHRNEGKKGE